MTTEKYLLKQNETVEYNPYEMWNLEILTENVNICGNSAYSAYTSETFDAARKLVDEYAGGNDDKLTAVLNALTGQTWRRVTLCGAMQCEWQYAWVTDEYIDADVWRLAAEYFNTGTWFDVYNGAGQCVDEIFLSDGYDAESYAAECVRRYEYSVCAVDLIDGYITRPKYKKYIV